MERRKVEKFRTADRGHGLRAVAPLHPGELLFRSDPLAYTVCKGSRGVVCDHCLLGKEKLLRCSQCQVAKYCGAKCQVSMSSEIFNSLLQWSFILLINFF
ncbi:histone-lysine N-methyltransferase SMYD3-like [Erinaceus europaeus]|uniref:[histone H3]-lysine(4) N-trimethyltransferase n=1 Tax=Erinaceus europaeus TaxID=9365 RepID=A0ABM3XGY7_ERIEU|nr:histone-lysine N-methyltransferase SMYD3-like [Erinaceus europaeus]